MVLTPSQMVPLGTPAHDFTLIEPRSGKMRSLKDLRSDKGTVIIFMCNHCPYVVHIMPALVPLSKKYMEKGIAFVGINANDIENYPDDAPDKMIAFQEKWGFDFPYLFDETQQTAKAYRAACTPDIYVFDGGMKLYYRGRFDATRPGSGSPPTGEDLAAALDALLQGQEPPKEQFPSVGCNIKWKP